MTLEQAIALGQEVDRSRAFVLVAIGRFLPPSELRTGQAPVWGVSVLARADPDDARPTVLWDAHDWRAISGAVAFAESSVEQLSPTAQQRPDAKFRNQPTLF
jgi:hypothetical protein